MDEAVPVRAGSLQFGASHHFVPDEERILPKNVLTRFEANKSIHEAEMLYKRMIASERRMGAGKIKPYVINRPK